MGDLRKLLWFHAFRRPTVGEVLSVLHEGPRPTPPTLSKTSTNESTLGISPPCVYMYLGLTSEEFGDCIVVFKQEQFEGSASPFDTGGLVKYIHPVCSWKSEEKREFLRACTWPTKELPARLDGYPSPTLERLEAYLNQARPNKSGPHEIWAGLPHAEIWSWPDNQWPAWTWEGRRPDLIPAGFRIYRWTCTPERYTELLKHLSLIHLSSDILKHLVQSYVHGGASQLVRKLRIEQEG